MREDGTRRRVLPLRGTERIALAAQGADGTAGFAICAAGSRGREHRARRTWLLVILAVAWIDHGRSGSCGSQMLQAISVASAGKPSVVNGLPD